MNAMEEIFDVENRPQLKKFGIAELRFCLIDIKQKGC
jgi:hypothetical protein